MRYTVLFYDERFEVSEDDKKKIELAVDDDIKFVTLSNGRKIDPLGVKEFRPVEEPLYFDLEGFDFGEEHQKMMLDKIQERKIMFSKYTKNKNTLEQIKTRGLQSQDEKEKVKLREEYKRIENEQKDWTNLISELKNKDKRPEKILEYSPYKKDGVLYYRLMEYDNKRNKVRVLNETTTAPKGWGDKMRYLTVEN